MHKILGVAAIAIAMVFTCIAPVSAQGMKSMEMATNLGSVLAAEKACDLSYNQDAIEVFIEENVDADDMSFPALLQTMTAGGEYQISGMSESALTAHCMQVKRIAKSYNFIQ